MLGFDAVLVWLGVAGLVAAVVVVVVFGVLATAANYETHGPALGWLLSNQLWGGLVQVLAVLLSAAGELLAACTGRSNR